MPLAAAAICIWLFGLLKGEIFWLPAGWRGAAMGLFYAATGVTTLGASVLAGALWDHAGAGAALGAGSAFAVLALAALPFVGRRRAQ